jgi:hypothetical protein
MMLISRKAALPELPRQRPQSLAQTHHVRSLRLRGQPQRKLSLTKIPLATKLMRSLTKLPSMEVHVKP